MDDHEQIWLQPECCADETNGRVWCQDPDPEACDDGVPWTRYVRADLHDDLRRQLAERDALVKAAFDEGMRSGELVGSCWEKSEAYAVLHVENPEEYKAAQKRALARAYGPVVWNEPEQGEE